MDLSSFVYVNPAQRDSMIEFLDSNALVHQSVHNQLLANGYPVEQYPLWTEDGKITEEWVEDNAQECRTWSTVLGFATPTDIDDLDPSNEASFQDWLANYGYFVNLVVQQLGL